MIENLRKRLNRQKTGLGLAALGRPGYMTLTHHTDLPDKSKSIMETHAHMMFDLAWENGIRYFDTARSYGAGEEFLASWLSKKHLKPNDLVIGSKWGYVYTANWQVNAEKHEIKYHTIENLSRQWQESQSILGKYLSIYHIHSATLESGVLDDLTILKKLAKIKESGVAVGLSLTGSNQSAILEKALKINIDGQRLFQSVQATWNLLETSIERQLMEAHEAGLFVILKEVMANGRIPGLSTRHLDEVRIRRIKEIATNYQILPDQLAMNAASQLPYIDIALSGAANKDHLLSNLHQMDQVIDRSALLPLAESPDAFWAKRSQLEWT